MVIGSEKEDKLRKNEIKVHETPEDSKKEPTITNDYFHYSDDYYDQFCKPSLYFTPSVQKYTHTPFIKTHSFQCSFVTYRFQKNLFLPLRSPTSDSGISSEKSPPVLTKSDFIICKYLMSSSYSM